MAIILVEGFDAYNGIANTTASAIGVASRWTCPTTSILSMVAGRFGGQALRITNGSLANPKSVYISVPPANTGTVGFAIYPEAIPTTESYILMLMYNTPTNSSANGQLVVSINPSGYIRVSRGSTANVLATSSSPIVANSWYYIELEFLIADSGGFVNLYVNGALAGSASGVDTRNLTATDTYNILLLNTDDTNTTYGNINRYDDLYLTDTASRLGEQRVVTVVPTSDSTPSQWSASGGAVAPYTMVDEVLCNGDTDYIFDGTVGDRAVFNMASTGATPLSVSAVQLGTFSRKTDTGTRAIQLQYVSGGGTAYNSSDITLGSTYGRQLSLLQTNPATSTAWTPTEANNLKVGVRISA